ncbi:MAG TPA: alpha/beta hydrolase [Byssovorax sp.]|jgi:pimeloyl-ACP methyl ester carboxylesterase
MRTASPSQERLVRDVTARGVRTRVIEAGDDDAPALVLVHGFLVSHRAFDDVIDPLAERFHVIAPDLPGFGESEKPSPARYAYGVESFTEAIADVIAAFGVGRASVLGHAMGGAVALTLAAQHAELVQRLVVVDPLCYPAPMGFWQRLALTPVVGGFAFKQFFGRRAFRAYFREDVAGPRAAPSLERIDWHYARFNSPSARESAYAALQAVHDARAVAARVTRITTPTLVVWGRDDAIFPPQSAARLAREILGAKLAVMDSGHAPHEEQPDAFVDLVVQFLEGRR